MKNYEDAVKALNGALLRKQAGGVIDSLFPSEIPSSYLNLHPYSAISRIIAGVGDAPTKEEIEDYDKHPIRGLFNSPYRDIRRRREILARAGRDAGSHVAAEEIAAPGLVLGALLGGGAALSYDDRAAKARRVALDATEGVRGSGWYEAYNAAKDAAMNNVSKKRKYAEIGAGSLGIAAIAAELAAPIVAAITPTRTAEEQLKHDKGSAWKSWLIPGVAGYNRWKRLGRIIAEDAERVRPQEKIASANPEEAVG